MKPIDRSEVLSLGDYEAIRASFRQRVVGAKRDRRANVGDRMSVIFENRDTVLLQIQEMLRTERITSEKGIAHEIETYNELVPGADQLSFTLFIEVDDKEAREALLVAVAGMESHVFLAVDGTRFPAVLTDRAGASAERASAVQYYKADLPAEVAQQLRGRDVTSVAVVVDHPGYRAEADLRKEVVAQLADDLAEPS